jgi:hypothetical protein
MRIPLPLVILKALAWIAYPWLLVLAKVARCFDDFYGYRTLFPSRIVLMTSKPLAIFYEHPDWFRPLFAELDSRGDIVGSERAI